MSTNICKNWYSSETVTDITKGNPCFCKIGIAHKKCLDPASADYQINYSPDAKQTGPNRCSVPSTLPNKCVYDPKKMSWADIKQYVQNNPNKPWLPAKWCAQLSNGKCFPEMDRCTRTHSDLSTVEDLWCSAWYNKLGKNAKTKNDDKELAANFACGVCSKDVPDCLPGCGACENVGLAECLCTNRHKDPTYIALKKHPILAKLADNCWYAPCASDTTSYVPTSATVGPCTQEACKAILEVANVSGKVDIANIKRRVLCNVKQNATDPIDVVGLSQPIPDTLTLLKTHVIAIIICIILVAMVCAA